MVSLRKTVLLTGLVMASAATSVVSLPAQAQELNTGNLIGGIAGALIGSNVGGGSGRVAATAAGGIIGAIVGGNVERGNAYAQGYAPQQGYANSYSQQAPQYQQSYDTVGYAQPVYSQPSYATSYTPVYSQPAYAPVYTQPSYAYVQPSYAYVQPSYGYVQPAATVVYSQSYYRGNGGYRGYERHEYRDQRGYERFDHDRRDHDRYDR